jgi:hypothetical protein
MLMAGLNFLVSAGCIWTLDTLREMGQDNAKDNALSTENLLRLSSDLADLHVASLRFIGSRSAPLSLNDRRVMDSSRQGYSRDADAFLKTLNDSGEKEAFRGFMERSLSYNALVDHTASDTGEQAIDGGIGDRII